jgi:putative transposase
MPRKARIDAPEALHHIIVRGIEHRKIFWDDADRDSFANRLGLVLTETHSDCFAWALIPNHAHPLLRTGLAPISTVMRRLLTGYAVQSTGVTGAMAIFFRIDTKIFCQQDPSLKELVRYHPSEPIAGQTCGRRDNANEDHGHPDYQASNSSYLNLA